MNKIISFLIEKLSGISAAVVRYPLTSLFLLGIFVINSLEINQTLDNYLSYLLTLVFGALLSIFFQHLYETFFLKKSSQGLILGVTLVLTILFYFTLASGSGLEIHTKIGVIMFALSLGFIWIPSIKNTVDFNDTFLAAFRAFFLTILFSLVLTLGIYLIFLAVDSLLFSLDFLLMEHVINFVASLFAPMFFLSMLPEYFGKKSKTFTPEERRVKQVKINDMISPPDLLNKLISYIVIPLLSIYTIVLVFYIAINISGSFWSDNLLEPLLVSYIVIVIITHLLACKIDNKITDFFTLVFPKLLIVIVLFQTTASILKIADMGITSGRYFVILFGVFALITGLIFSFLNNRKNGLIVAVFLILAFISIVPPVDAFTISKNNQIKLVEKTLEKNDMLKENSIIPKNDLPLEDKITISKALSYLNLYEYEATITWLPKNYDAYQDFQAVFGFEQTHSSEEAIPADNNKYVALDKSTGVMKLPDADYMTTMYFYEREGQVILESSEDRVIEDRRGDLYLKASPDWELVLTDQKAGVLLAYDLNDLFARFYQGSELLSSQELSLEEASFVKESDQIKLTVIVDSLSKFEDGREANLLVFLKFK